MTTIVYSQRPMRKSMIAAYLLWLILGGVGIHRFYLGQSGSGIAMLLIFLFGFLFMPLWVVTILWWFIDLFLIPSITHDVNGGNMQVTRIEEDDDEDDDGPYQPVSISSFAPKTKRGFFHELDIATRPGNRR